MEIALAVAGQCRVHDHGLQRFGECGHVEREAFRNFDAARDRKTAGLAYTTLTGA